MTNIVEFRPLRSGRTRQTQQGEAGRILLFTGVRYMREVEASAPVEPAARIAEAVPTALVSTERLLA